MALPDKILARKLKKKEKKKLQILEAKKAQEEAGTKMIAWFIKYRRNTYTINIYVFSRIIYIHIFNVSV